MGVFHPGTNFPYDNNQSLNNFIIVIILDHGSCSRIHAALVWHKHLERSFLVDLGSSKFYLFTNNIKGGGEVCNFHEM